MKRLFLGLFILMFWVGVASATPFIMYTPQAATVQQYEIDLNGAVETVAPTTTAEGHSQLVYDVGALTPGGYTIKARIKYRGWPVFTSWSSDYGFAVPDISIPPDNPEIIENP